MWPLLIISLSLLLLLYLSLSWRFTIMLIYARYKLCLERTFRRIILSACNIGIRLLTSNYSDWSLSFAQWLMIFWNIEKVLPSTGYYSHDKSYVAPRKGARASISTTIVAHSLSDRKVSWLGTVILSCSTMTFNLAMGCFIWAKVISILRVEFQWVGASRPRATCPEKAVLCSPFFSVALAKSLSFSFAFTELPNRPTDFCTLVIRSLKKCK